MGWAEPRGTTVELRHADFVAYSEVAVAAREFLRRGTTANRERLAEAIALLDTIPVGHVAARI